MIGNKGNAMYVLMQEAEARRSNGSGGAARTPRFAQKDWDDAFEGNGHVLHLRFGDGTVIDFDASQCDDLTRHRLMMHGASQKIGDSYSSVKGDVQEAKRRAQETIDLLYRNEWTGEREGGGPRLGELIAAISRIRGVDEERVKQAVEAASDEEREKWRSNAQVKAMVQRIRAEKAQAALEAAGDQPLQINLGG